MTLGEPEKAGAIFWVMVSQLEIAWKEPGQGKKVTKSISCEPMVVETWLTPQSDCKSGFSGQMQANYTHVITGSAPKMNYSDIQGPLMVKC